MNAAVQNLARSAAGMFVGGMNVKAVLCVKNPTIPVEPEQLAQNAVMAQEELLKETASALEDSQRMLGQASKTAKDIAYSLSQTIYIPVEFQFNPSTIRMESVGGEVQNLRNVGEGAAAEELRKMKYKPRTIMSFDVYFDDTLNADAFMLENLTPNIGNLASIGKDLIKTAMANKGKDEKEKKKTHSVRQRMDALMGLLTSRASQHVIFFWANMSFRGQLTRVSSEYTMFNPKGNPIRGKVSLQITQDAEDAEIMQYDEKYWDNAFQRMFSEQDSAGMKLANKILNNNFLNIGL